MMRVEVKPKLLRWARERARVSLPALAKTFPDIAEWEQGTARPTLKQVERFASVTHAPIGYLFLAEPPVERIPIPDFRTVEGEQPRRPSPELLDTIYLCEQRQEWYRDFARSIGEVPLPFVGSVSPNSDVVDTAASMRHALHFDVGERARARDWAQTLSSYIGRADDLGILVMCSGVVGSNNRRALDPDEFRGFAMADPMAPLVFINGADTKAAQMFTLAHELAHVWLGQSALSDAQAAFAPGQDVERWCNQVAVELLVPLEVFRTDYRCRAEVQGEARRLSRQFKVSTLVILRRMHDAGGLSQARLWDEYRAELKRLLAFPRGGGGNFYLTQAARASRRFTRAVIVSALEGRSSFTDAFRLLGVKKMKTFEGLGRTVGAML
ncbi:MAG: ImmA/IrrE family metallo-endopeptidase [Deltaproteobacteria bacterium]|nr:ImmA/IrrE family metallo-endopeptidase [Deltaproteobacteria bacterium]